MPAHDRVVVFYDLVNFFEDVKEVEALVGFLELNERAVVVGVVEVRLAFFVLVRGGGGLVGLGLVGCGVPVFLIELGFVELYILVENDVLGH